MKNYIENLNWRYATKQFDPTKKISQEELDFLLEAIQLSASSYGLQPYEIIVVDNAQIQEKLKAAAWNQSQLTDASHVLVFANMKSVDENYVDAYMDTIAKTRKLKVEDLSGFKDMIKNTILQLSDEDQVQWTAKQAYIALGNLLSAAANFKIDVCPMEGFSAEEFDEILGLKERNLTAAAIATVGFRSAEDQTQFAAKVRKSKEDLFTTV
ncbi:Nitroreductase [Gillisia sp. Hel1_33_143]|uniref:NAD(P)H-dependent oxidoreductase n=1 Tax=Gillisia sp. Hel1_33_143 TaxID=1336796 RepID=UPI00087B220A|nr:NAD(P)H-dependent oxidoreductase [Gillisia sp. Hel1_33_143]SDR66324.1 Nitroreductase [Gillisia sp. Hel1_33_143]